MRRGEIYHTKERVAERGHKPGFYVVVSRNFVAENDDISTVICAPIYSEVLGLRSEKKSFLGGTTVCRGKVPYVATS